MTMPPKFHRWINGLRTLGLLVSVAAIAMVRPSMASEPAQKPAVPPLGRPEPDIVASNVIRLNDEIADSVQRRLRSSPKVKGDVLESENVLNRPVEQVVVDEMKPWRARLESAVKNYEMANGVAPEQKIAEDLLIGIVTSPDAPVDIQRDALKALAQIALDGKFYSKAQMIYSQMVDRFPKHPDTPAILYRQGILYRRVGANELALSKLNAVMSSVLGLSDQDLPSYKSMVLMAQTEIADTYFMAGNFNEAANYFKRVLKLADEDLNEAQVRLKLVKSYFEMKDWKNVITEGQLAIEKVALSSQTAEVRFLMVEAFKKLGLQREALEQTLALLGSEQARSSKDPDNWAYWQKRTGNKLANELYERGDYINALVIYQTLRRLPGDDIWQSQALYQMGLIYERLEQPEQAMDAYTQILSFTTNAVAEVSAPGPSGSTPPPPTAPSTAQATTNSAAADRGTGLSTASMPKIVEDNPVVAPSLLLLRNMAQWRLGNLQWDQGVQKQIRNLSLRRGSSGPPVEVGTASTNRITNGGTAQP